MNKNWSAKLTHGGLRYVDTKTAQSCCALPRTWSAHSPPKTVNCNNHMREFGNVFDVFHFENLHIFLQVWCLQDGHDVCSQLGQRPQGTELHWNLCSVSAGRLWFDTSHLWLLLTKHGVCFLGVALLVLLLLLVSVKKDNFLPIGSWFPLVQYFQ